MQTIFKVFVEFVTILLMFFVLDFGHKAHRGVEPALPVLEGEVLTTRLPGKFQGVILFEMEFILDENYNKRKLLLMIEI